MRKIRLAELEQHIPDELMERAERLSIIELKLLDKNLFSARIVDDIPLEVEVQLYGQRIQAYTCECEEFAAHQICPHVVTTFLRLRADKRKKAEERQTARRQRAERKPQKFNIQNVLQQVEGDELKAFVREFARLDRQFALALKARFAGRIELADSFDKYFQLLQSAIRLEKNPKGNFRAGGFKRVQQIIEHTLHHAESALDQEDFAECWSALHALFEVLPLLERALDDDRVLPKVYEPAFQVLEKLCQRELAPQFENQLWLMLLDLAFETRVQRVGLLPYFRTQLQAMLYSQERKIALLDVVEEQLDESNASIQVEMQLWQINLLIEFGEEERLREVFLQLPPNPRLLDALIRDLRQHQHWQAARWLVEGSLAQSALSSAFRPILEDELLTICIQLGDAEQATELAKKRFLASRRFTYLDQLKAISGRKWSRQRKALLKTLRQQENTYAGQRLLGQIYLREEMYKELIQLLKQASSLELMLELDTPLHQEQPEAIAQLYQDVLQQFLEQHLGPPAASKIRQVIRHLYELEAGELARSLVHQLRKQYGWRQSLMEELNIFH